MTMVTLTMNGQEISAPAGSTVLQTAKLSGIDIPTLCHHPALVPVGACRICLVEIAGQRSLQTACTFPINSGMDVQTESPRVVAARKLVLDLLFSERNHYCMFCEMSGNCELQNLGYRYGIDHWVYPAYTQPFPVDATHDYVLMEHNRCVLCWRCLRACDELVANHTLGLRQRGAKTMIHMDLNLPFGESSCISCGTCRQVCPTGALFDRRSAFMGRDVQTDRVKTTCGQCSVGCGMEVVTRGGDILRIDSDWEADVNGGLLCRMGRFNPLYDKRQRVTRPLIRRKGKLEEASWDEALQTIAERIGGAGAKEIGVLTSGKATNEALHLLGRLFRDELKATNIGLIKGAAPRPFGKPLGSLADITQSDLIMVVGADPVKDQPVASFFVKRTVDKGVRLIVVDGEENGLAPFAYMNLPMADIGEAVEIALRAEQPVVVYGVGLTEKAADALKILKGKATFVALEPGANARAAAIYGINNGFQPRAVKILYLLPGEEDWDGTDVMEKIGKTVFVVLQTSFVSPLTGRADVVLPAAIWSEREGSLTNTEGRVRKVSKVLEPQGEAKADWEILSLLADRLGRKLGTSFDEISARAIQELG